MILNTGARTDTAQYFSDWLLKRFEEIFESSAKVFTLSSIDGTPVSTSFP